MEEGVYMRNVVVSWEPSKAGRTEGQKYAKTVRE